MTSSSQISTTGQLGRGSWGYSLYCPLRTAIGYHQDMLHLLPRIRQPVVLYLPPPYPPAGLQRIANRPRWQYMWLGTREGV